MDVIDTYARRFSDSAVVQIHAITHGDGFADASTLHFFSNSPSSSSYSAFADDFLAQVDTTTLAAAWYPGTPLVRLSDFAHIGSEAAAAMQTIYESWGHSDGLGAVAYPQPGVAFVLGVSVEDSRALGTATQHRLLRRVPPHLDAGVRLRMRPDATLAAVLRSDGRLVDADGDHIAAQRERLAGHVRAVEHARARATRSSPDALALWRALVDGAYTIVPRTVSGSVRREYHFIRNSPLGRADARLTARELAVLRQSARGFAQKEVAYALGLSQAAVSSALERGRLRLGLESRTALIKVARACFGHQGQILTKRDLTGAERHILALLQEGLSNADIARIRGASKHTVANQVAAILHKTGARSRRDLATLPGD